MERGTTRIVAIVVVAIVVGGGIGLWMWLNPSEHAWTVADCPGVPEGTTVSADRILKLGVIGDIGERTGDGALNGVMLAAAKINAAGGVKVGIGRTFYFGVCSEDTNEAATSSKTEDGTRAAERLLYFWKVDVVIGGFRTERVLEYAPIIMAQDIPFISTGVALDLFCFDTATWTAANVSHVKGALEYEKDPIKYAQLASDLPYVNFFRIMPLKVSAMATQIARQAVYLNSSGIQQITSFNVIREDHAWNMLGYLTVNGYLQAMGFARGRIENVSMTATSTDLDTQMAAFWDNVSSTYNNSVTIPFISAGTASAQMLKNYKLKHPGSYIMGIDVPSQELTYFSDTGGDCAYEINYLTTMAGVNKTTLTIPFWEAYVAKYSKEPTYTAIGSYDAVLLMNRTARLGGSLDGPVVRRFLENNMTTQASAMEAVGGRTYFDAYHDLQMDYSGIGYNYGMFVQWNSNGSKVLLPSNQYSAMNFPVVGTYQKPAWWV